MRVFVYEHVTGGGLSGESLPVGLRREGEQMLASLLRDLDELGIAICFTRDARLAPLPGRSQYLAVGSAASWRQAWERGVAWADAVWPIAPESGGILTRVSAAVIAARRILLGSRPSAVALATSKLGTYRQLHRGAITTIPTWPAEAMAQGTGPWIVKPDDGAGCVDTRVIEGRRELTAWRRVCRAPHRYVLQPYLSGNAASLSLICGGKAPLLLSFNRQLIQRHGNRLVAHGVRVASCLHRRGHWQNLVEQVAKQVPGLWGYLGIDLLVQPGGRIRVVEINPRLTLSYVGLRAGLGINAAALVLELARQRVL